MPEPKKTKPVRRISRQREAGEATRKETRRLVLVAAREEFAERGYSAATVARIAQRAGVVVQTLYSAWGSKRELLRGVMETSIMGDDTKMFDDSPPINKIIQIPPEIAKDAHAILGFFARQFRVLSERAALGWQTYRDAAAVDPEAAEDWQQLMNIRRGGFRIVVSQLPKGCLRKGLTEEMAADTMWVIASPDTHDQLVRRAGYSYDAFEEWVRTMLVATLLK